MHAEKQAAKYRHTLQLEADATKGLYVDSVQASILKAELIGKTIGAGWYIDGAIGFGKSAVVMSASNGSISTAVKVFHPELIERYGRDIQLQRILREKSLVGASHPNLVKILDGGECKASGYLHIVMERLQYDNLASKIQDVPREKIVEIVSQLASAARFLEDRNLAHRDIKPENIAISNDFAHTVLLDLGVLRPFGAPDLTDVEQRAFIGTLRYSSPEFLLRKEGDSVEGWRAITFYQIGAVLHDLLMRKPLFQDQSDPFGALVKAVLEEIPSIQAEIPRAVSLAKSCLVKDPQLRLQLVDWSNFTKEWLLDQNTADANEESIRKRQRHALATRSERSIPNGERARRLKNQLDDVSNRLESRLSAEISALRCFPLRTTKSEQSAEQRTCTITLQFEKDNEKALTAHLTICVRAELLGENNGVPIYSAHVTAAISDQPLTGSIYSDGLPVVKGEIETLLDGEYLRRELIAALEDAYAAIDRGEAPIGGMLLLQTQRG